MSLRFLQSFLGLHLYKKADRRNVVLVDKLLLSLVKKRKENYTSDWLEQNQEDLIKVDYPNQKLSKIFIVS